jgi:erythromycin esterase-like protein
MRRWLTALMACGTLAAAGACGAQPNPSAADDASLTAAAARADFVLMGESTHGTREYYQERARLSEQLFREHGFRAIGIEGDWSGAERVNRYVRGLGSDRTADEALSDFRAFPVWMWRNAEFRDFVERLRALNLSRAPQDRVGVYGLDVYDMFDAADAALAYLAQADAEAGRRARTHYACFARHRRSPERYSLAQREPKRSCQAAAEAIVAEVARLPAPTADEAEARFAAERAAATLAGGEEYFRVQQTTGYSWNARDRRMAAGARRVSEHLARSGKPGKMVIWAHNTHVGDARESEMKDRGELSLGQLLRQDGRAFLLGFLTYQGEVLAAEAWDAAPRRFRVRPAMSGSQEAVLEQRGQPRLLLSFAGRPAEERRLQRAIGVVYMPNNERQAHYMWGRIDRQFDALIFIRDTRAVTALPAPARAARRRDIEGERDE